jgi:hypothetical protein
MMTKEAAAGSTEEASMPRMGFVYLICWVVVFWLGDPSRRRR